MVTVCNRLNYVKKGKTTSNEIVIFTTEDGKVSLDVQVENETVWLSRNQISELFNRDIKTIGKHINNALKEEVDI